MRSNPHRGRHISWLAEADALRTSVILPVRDGIDHTRRFLESVRRCTTDTDLEVLIVDDGSGPKARGYLDETGFVAVRNPESRGFPCAVNQGVSASHGDLLVICNNDIVCTPDWLELLTACVLHDPLAGAVGPLSNNISDWRQRVEPGYANLGSLDAFARHWTLAHSGDYRRTTRLGMGVLAIPRRVWDEVGPLDEQFAPGNFEDDDYSLRLMLAGYRLYIAGDCYVHHTRGNVFRADDPGFAVLLGRNGDLFRRNWRLSPGATLYADVDTRDLLPPEVRRLLHLGCGAGALGVTLEAGGTEVVGEEPEEVMARVARSCLSAIVQLEDLPCLPARSFDAAILTHALERCPQPEQLLLDVRSLLRPGATLIVEVDNVATLRVLLDILRLDWIRDGNAAHRADTRHFFTISSLGRLLEGLGFQIQGARARPIATNEDGDRVVEALAGVVAAFGGDAEIFAERIRHESYIVSALYPGER